MAINKLRAERTAKHVPNPVTKGGRTSPPETPALSRGQGAVTKRSSSLTRGRSARSSHSGKPISHSEVVGAKSEVLRQPGRSARARKVGFAVGPEEKAKEEEEARKARGKTGEAEALGIDRPVDVGLIDR